MIIVGHPWVESQTFRSISSLSDIKETKTNDIVVLSSLENTHAMAGYCQKNHVAYAIRSSSLKDALFANVLGAKYLICEPQHAKEIQTVAQEYLFDTRILAEIENEEEMTALAKAGIDGVIFTEVIL